MYSQVDREWYNAFTLDSIVDFQKTDSDIKKRDDYIATKSIDRYLRKYTIGWKLLVRFKDDTEQWFPLWILKETNPVDVELW